MAMGSDKHPRALSPISRRAFLAAGPVAVGAGLAVGAGVAGCGGGGYGGYVYADYVNYSNGSCGYCNGAGRDYYHCDGAYCNYFNA